MKLASLQSPFAPEWIAWECARQADPVSAGTGLYGKHHAAATVKIGRADLIRCVYDRTAALEPVQRSIDTCCEYLANLLGGRAWRGKYELDVTLDPTRDGYNVTVWWEDE